MNVEKLESQANILFANIDSWESSVIERIGKRIKAIGEMSVADVKALNNIADVKSDMQEIIKELAKVTGLNISQIEQIYGDTLAEVHLENNPLYDYRGKRFVPFEQNKELQSIVRTYSKTTGETMINLSKTSAQNLGFVDEHGKFQGIQEFYTDVLDRAVMQVASGALDYNSAMRNTIVAMGGSGMRVNYGGGIFRRLDTAIRQSLLWGAKKAAEEYDTMIGEELGCDGIEIDYHRNSRPSHRFMQGKQYSISGKKTIDGITYQDAKEAGVIDALNDYNCLHFKTSIILGVSEPAYDEEQLKKYEADDDKHFEIDGKSKNGYGWSQDMRKLETAMREQKRIKVAAQASGDKELVKQCNTKIKAYQAKYEQISNITGIRQDPSRFTIPREPHKINDVLTTKNSGGIINTKVSNNKVVNPMDSTKYHKMRESLERNGYKVIEAKDDDLGYLKSINAEASYGYGYLMHIGEIPSASAMFEEVIHATQARKYGELVSSEPLEVYSREIAANRMLLKHKKAYGFDKIDIEDITRNLSIWESKYKKLMGYTYDEGSCFREI